MIAIQNDFAGGLNLFDDDTNLKDNEVRLLFNGRTRFGYAEPAQQSELQTGLPAGNMQGGIGVGNIAIAFVDGLAYYRYEGTSTWFQIASFQMDALVDRIYACAVPKSTYDFIRRLNNSANERMLVTTDYKIAGNPAGIVVQDGINQPWLIEFNGTTQQFVARVTKNYSQWDNTGTAANSREYVPIGLQMFYVNQKLYVVTRDKKAIYQSITGRPLDFMINVDANGNKLATESQGGADSVSFAMDSDEITCVQPINIPNSFIYGTARRTRIITADYTRTLFDEPRYTETALINVGINNQESVAEILGDYVLCDAEGVKSFNAVKNLRIEGLNSVFSLPISKLFNRISQQATAITYLDNYALVYCRTIYGDATLVYDGLRQLWTSIDITEVIKVKQFFTTKLNEIVYAYAVCGNGKLWRIYSSSQPATAAMLTRSIVTDDAKREHKSQFLKAVFRRGSVKDGTARAIEYVDEQVSNDVTQQMDMRLLGINYPVRPPVIPSNNNIMLPLTFQFTKGLNGNKLAYILQWNTDAQLMNWQVVTTESSRDVGFRQTSNT